MSPRATAASRPSSASRVPDERVAIVQRVGWQGTRRDERQAPLGLAHLGRGHRDTTAIPRGHRLELSAALAASLIGAAPVPAPATAAASTARAPASGTRRTRRPRGHRHRPGPGPAGARRRRLRQHVALRAGRVPPGGTRRGDRPRAWRSRAGRHRRRATPRERPVPDAPALTAAAVAPRRPGGLEVAPRRGMHPPSYVHGEGGWRPPIAHDERVGRVGRDVRRDLPSAVVVQCLGRLDDESRPQQRDPDPAERPP